MTTAERNAVAHQLTDLRRHGRLTAEEHAEALEYLDATPEAVAA